MSTDYNNTSQIVVRRPVNEVSLGKLSLRVMTLKTSNDANHKAQLAPEHLNGLISSLSVCVRSRKLDLERGRGKKSVFSG